MATLTTVELRVSEDIAAGQDVSDTYTPPDGATVWIIDFHGDAAFTTNAVVKALWEYGTGSESILWSCKGADRFTNPIKITGADGIKKIAISCSNGETGNLILSGYLKLKVKT